MKIDKKGMYYTETQTAMTKERELAFQELQEMNDILLPRKFGKAGKAWLAVLLLFCLAGLFAYIKQLKLGLTVTGLGDIFSWGIYISNFVFFVAVSLVGSLITAILRLTNVQWRAPLTRIAEVIAVSAIIFAGLIIIVDMGRPDRIHHLFLYGRIQSPIVWDVLVISTYMVISLLLLYIPLLPGIAFCRDQLTDISKWRQKFYRILSLGWKGTSKQYKLMKKSIRILVVLIVPVALSIHTVTSWLFATTFRAGWDSTNFGPYFVAGAFVVGAAAVIAAMFVIRKTYGFENFLTDKHFDRMGKLLVMLILVYLYFSVNEYLVPGYKMSGHEAGHLKELMVGEYAFMFWAVQIGGMIIPLLILLFRKGRRPAVSFWVAIAVIIGAWYKRYIIVIPTFHHPFLPLQEVPEAWMHYVPTWEEWMITLGSLAGALLVMTILFRLFPICSIWEIAEERGIEEEVVHDYLKSKIIKNNENLHTEQ